LEKEEQRLINEISHHENQLETELNDSKRKELLLALEIASLKLKINGLELEIYAYKIALENATTDEEKQRLSDLINKARDTLNVQLQQKQSSSKSLDLCFAPIFLSSTVKKVAVLPLRNKFTISRSSSTRY
jgi:VIT1/CCC1 family predicted Fe2+/Mn2+ transporter